MAADQRWVDKKLDTGWYYTLVNMHITGCVWLNISISLYLKTSYGAPPHRQFYEQHIKSGTGFRQIIVIVFQDDKNIVYLLHITLIFSRCRHSWAVTVDAMWTTYLCALVNNSFVSFNFISSAEPTFWYFKYCNIMLIARYEFDIIYIYIYIFISMYTFKWRKMTFVNETQIYILFQIRVGNHNFHLNHLNEHFKHPGDVAWIITNKK